MTQQHHIKPLARLMGLETEYAIRMPGASRKDGQRQLDVYRAFIHQLRRRLPLAKTDYFRNGKLGVFAANGAAVWFERIRFYGDHGLIEGCTPECMGPRQLLAAQRGLDRLMEETLRRAYPEQPVGILKNCRDARGNTYGAQENYEVQFASRWQAALWKSILVICIWLARFFLLLMVLIILPLALVNSLLFLPVYQFQTRHLTDSPADQHRRIFLRSYWFGAAWFEDGETGSPFPLWMEQFCLLLVRLPMFPIAAIISLASCFTEFHRTQNRLVPLLVSRLVIAGSGNLDRRGRFYLSEKARSRSRVFVSLLIDFDQPIFSLNHFLKEILAAAAPPFHRSSIFEPRQRMQITIGDSNMCEEAEYLKIATTALVIDTIEAGFLNDYPAIRFPIWNLRKIDRDPTLQTRVPTSLGKKNAIELQRFYLQACQKYADSLPLDESIEPGKIIRLWCEVLDLLEHDPQALFGRIDWITKRQLLESLGTTASFESRKKLDLKFHELAADGYYCQLNAASQTTSILDASEIEQATRLPPPVSPANLRGNYIREFGDEIEWAYWNVIKLKKPNPTEFIYLSGSHKSALGPTKKQSFDPAAHADDFGRADPDLFDEDPEDLGEAE
jgi:proteasome accessory factor A